MLLVGVFVVIRRIVYSLRKLTFLCCSVFFRFNNCELFGKCQWLNFLYVGRSVCYSGQKHIFMTGICVLFHKSMCFYLQKHVHVPACYLAEVCFFVGKMCVVGRSFALDGCHWPWVHQVWVDDLNKTLKGLWRDGWWQGE